MAVTPEQFADCIRTIAQDPDPAEFAVRALVHAADALQHTAYAEGANLIIETLAEIQRRPRQQVI